jgi:hypothetical protein
MEGYFIQFDLDFFLCENIKGLSDNSSLASSFKCRNLLQHISTFFLT